MSLQCPVREVPGAERRSGLVSAAGPQAVVILLSVPRSISRSGVDAPSLGAPLSSEGA